MNCHATTTGGWSSFKKLTAQDKSVFEQAVKGLMGVIYKPLYVSTQVVSGMNYLFLAEAIVMNGSSCYMDLVTVSAFKALNGTVTLGEIKSIRP